MRLRWDNVFTGLMLSFGHIQDLRLPNLEVSAAGLSITPIVDVINLPGILRGAFERRGDDQPIMIDLGATNPVGVRLARAEQAAV